MKLTLFAPVFGVLLLCSSGCGSQNSSSAPEDLIPEQQYLSIVAESRLLKSYESTYSDSLKTDSLKKALLSKYAVTAEQLMRSHTYYSLDIEKQKMRLEQVDRLLQTEMERIQVAAGASQPDSTQNNR
jgi:hypothetical protein